MSLLQGRITSIDFASIPDRLRAGLNPNAAYYLEKTLLHFVVEKEEKNVQEAEEHLQLVRVLIHFGADVNCRDINGTTPLHFAVEFRKYKMMELLLNNNAGIDMQDELLNSPLHYAIDNCYKFQPIPMPIYNFERPRDRSYTDLETVKLLMKYHPNINICNCLSQTPLIWAVKQQNLQTVQVLLKEGALHSLSDFDRNGPLHYSLYRTEIDVDIVTELLKHGSDLASRNNRFECPIDVYLKILRNASPAELKKATDLFKLFVFWKNYFNDKQCEEIIDISRKTKSILRQFFWYCRFEIEQMKDDEVGIDCTVYDLASRGFYYKTSKEISYSVDIYDKILKKLKRGEYAVYIDMIASGICREYLADKASESGYWVDRNGEEVEFLNFDTRFRLCCYLSNFEMFNLLLAFSSTSSTFKIHKFCSMLYKKVSM